MVKQVRLGIVGFGAQGSMYTRMITDGETAAPEMAIAGWEATVVQQNPLVLRYGDAPCRPALARATWTMMSAQVSRSMSPVFSTRWYRSASRGSQP